MPRPHRFPAPVLFDPEVEAGYMKHFVPVPEDVARSLQGAARLVGKLDDRPFRRVFHERPDGSPCLKFGAGWLAEAKLTEGDEVIVELAADPEPDRVDLPEELELALAADPEAAMAWAALTPGKQRTLAYGVERAKRPETRRKRATATLEQVLGEATRAG